MENLNRMEIINWLYEHQKQKRFLHTLGVEQLAVHLAKIYGVDEETASIAALLHDCAKQMDTDELYDLLLKDGYNMKELKNYPQLFHAFAAPIVAQKVFGEIPQEILTAICFHTTGHYPMSKLDMIIYDADFAEPNRKPFPDLEKARELLETDLRGATIFILESVNRHLMDQGKMLFPLADDAIRSLKNEIQAETQK